MAHKRLLLVHHWRDEPQPSKLRVYIQLQALRSLFIRQSWRSKLLFCFVRKVTLACNINCARADPKKPSKLIWVPNRRSRNTISNISCYINSFFNLIAPNYAHDLDIFFKRIAVSKWSIRFTMGLERTHVRFAEYFTIGTFIMADNKE